MATPLVPSEAVRDGQGILLIAGWLVVFACWVFVGCLRPVIQIRWRWVDTAVLLFLVVFSISALMVRGDGNVRYALNTMWSWISMGVLFLGFRQWVCTPTTTRAICAAMIAVSVCLSAHGLHQYFVKLPALRREYEADKRRFLRQVGIQSPLQSAEVREFEDRLRSKEPLATFALTNSLAGFLTPWSVVALALLASGFRGTGRQWLYRTAVAVGLITIVGCLVLTKSRAAYIACVVAAFLLTAGAWRKGQRIGWQRPLLGFGAMVLLVVGAVVTRGLDWRVVTEATKTLQFRLQYWEATLGVIRNNPFWGCGPGNFQQHSAALKLPQASETIADPHNFLLEVWAISGTVGLLSLAFVAATTVVLWHQRTRAPIAESVRSDASLEEPIWWVYASCGIVPIVVFAASILFGGVPDKSLMWIGMPAGAVLLALLYTWIKRGELESRWIVIAGFALLLNLLAAGGIGFPGVGQGVWVLLALIANHLDSRPPREWGRKPQLGLVLVVLVVGGFFWHSMYRPVTRFQPFLIAGQEHQQRGSYQLAIEHFRSAARIDSASVQPWRLLANLYQATNNRGEMQQAIEETLHRDPQSYALHQQMAELWLREGLPDRALPLLQRAVELYPNSGINHAQLAWVYHLAGRTTAARNHAGMALKLDLLNPHLEQKLKHQPLIGLGGERVDNAREVMVRLRGSAPDRNVLRARGANRLANLAWAGSRPLLDGGTASKGVTIGTVGTSSLSVDRSEGRRILLKRTAHSGYKSRNRLRDYQSTVYGEVWESKRCAES